MGWWNQDIYGGDPPLWWRENIYSKCEVEEYNDKHTLNPISKEVLSKKIDDIINLIDTGETDDDKNIGYQVLGAIIMHSGFDIDESKDLRKIIIKASEDDNYAKEDLLRKNAMKNFKNIVKNYDSNNPFDISTINIFKESDEVEEEISKEFKEIFDLMRARIKKLENGKEEKSGVPDYDKGYEDASQEEIDFLTDLMDLMSKMEMMGVLFEKIAQGLLGNLTLNDSEFESKDSKLKYAGAGVLSESSLKKIISLPGKDIMPG